MEKKCSRKKEPGEDKLRQWCARVSRNSQCLVWWRRGRQEPGSIWDTWWDLAKTLDSKRLKFFSKTVTTVKGWVAFTIAC